jgi:tetratricopeptide (TPR) repeat protein
VTVGQENTASRLAAVSGNGRYQYWGSALDAFSGHPIEGLGAGTFQFWWAAHGSIRGYVVNAHSLFFETLAETGLLGLALLLVVFGAGIAALASRWRRPAGNDRALLAAVLGACAAFCVAAGVDWVWQVPAIPVVFLLLIGGATARRKRRRPGQSRMSRQAGLARSAAWLALALVGVVALVVPMASGVSLRESQAQARVAHFEPALRDARTAGGWQPYAASPQLQQALVMEASADYSAAASVARKAVSAAPTDWKSWLVLSRIEAEAGRPVAAVAAYRKARSLDPRDPLFASP